jgi:uncharacterized protein YcfL
MKKIYFVFALATLSLAACNSNQGAFTEDEKKKQDSVDSEKHEDKFEALQKEIEKDSGSKTEQGEKTQGTEKK